MFQRTLDDRQVVAQNAEMQKAADAADISVLFFSAGANFWAILGHFGNFGSFLGQFGQFWVIFGLFWVIFGPFRQFWVIFGPFFGAIFLWQNMPLCYSNHFLQLC